ncbi:MAG: addiction module protein [Nitrospiria bacterium]
MKKDRIIQEINRLSLPEKLLLVEDIWDSIVLGDLELPIPQWQKEELDKRYQHYLHGKPSLHDWQDVHKSLRKEPAE